MVPLLDIQSKPNIVGGQINTMYEYCANRGWIPGDWQNEFILLRDSHIVQGMEMSNLSNSSKAENIGHICTNPMISITDSLSSLGQLTSRTKRLNPNVHAAWPITLWHFQEFIHILCHWGQSEKKWMNKSWTNILYNPSFAHGVYIGMHVFQSQN